MEKNKKEPELKATDNQTVENFAKKKKRFIIEKLTDLPVNHSIANKYLAEAIAYSTSLRTISFENRPYSFTSKDCKVICEGLLLNKSIDSLVFYHTLDVTDEALECFGQVFKQKKIRSVHFVQFYAKPRTTEKLVSYITNSDTIDRISMSLVASYQSSVEYLVGCLRSKQVKKFTIRRSAITDDQFNLLARYINNSNIMKLTMGHSMPEMNLTPIISAKNSVKKLTMQNNIKTVAEVTYLINAMKKNTTIEALKLDSDQNAPEDPINLAEQIGRLLVETKTLKRISFVDRSLTQYAINGIAMNTTLTALDLTVMTAELYDDLCETILNHPSIQRIKIRSIQTPNHLSSLNLIQKSKTLRDVDFSDSENLDEDILKSICKAIADKQVLHRIRLTLDTVSLVKNDLYWQTVTNCTSLYCFEIDYSCSKPFSTAIWSKIEAVLEKNSGVISIGKFTDSPEKVRQLLQKNNDIRLYSVANTKTFVSMMAKRSDSFTEKLPMEIWAMILKRINYLGVDIDFANMLLNSMNKS